MDDPSPAADARAQWHAFHFNKLVDACGGYGRVFELRPARVTNRGHLYGFGNPNIAGSAPADVIEDLERLCGKPIYSAALADSLPGSAAAGDVLHEACAATAEVGELMRLLLDVRQRRGGLSRRASDAILAAVHGAIGELKEVEIAVLEQSPVAAPAFDVDSNVAPFGSHHTVTRRAS